MQIKVNELKHNLNRSVCSETIDRSQKQIKIVELSLSTEDDNVQYS